MKNAAKVVIIIGLVLGTIGGSIALLSLAFGDTLIKTITQNQSQLPANSLQAIEGLKKATDKSPSHIMYLVSDLFVIVAGGVLGLLAAFASKKRSWRTVFAAIAILSGLGLLAFHHWIAAAAYAIGGFLLVILDEKDTNESKESPPGTGCDGRNA